MGAVTLLLGRGSTEARKKSGVRGTAAEDVCHSANRILFLCHLAQKGCAPPRPTGKRVGNSRHGSRLRSIEVLMADTLPKVDRAFLSVLMRGAEKTFENAERLYFEGEILAKVGATARALCLHQISLEECSKIENIGAWATSLLCGFEVDQEKILASFRRHSSKNKSNAYMLAGSKAEADAKARGDWEAARVEFKKLQMEFHEASNDAKNASLYVDWEDGEFVSPTEKITAEMLAQIAERNRMFLGYASNSLKMLKRLDKAPDDLQDLLVEFVAGAEKMRAEKPSDLMTAGNKLLQQFLEAGVNKLKNKPDWRA
jgi:AbiV family abortive infection protein